MGFKKGQNPNHPRKGSSIKVDPIRDICHIESIKRRLINADDMRGHCLFTVGLNTGLRACELRALKVRNVRGLKEGELMEIKQSKNRKYRKVPLNRACVRAIEFWLVVYSPESDDLPLFPSRNGQNALTVPTLCGMVKGWCMDAGAIGHFGSHTLRKSWGYHQRLTYQAPLNLLVKAYGHSSERQTMDYLGILPREISDLFKNEI